MPLFSIVLSLFAFSLFAQQNQKVNNRWAYYGSEFYKVLETKEKFDRSYFNRLFNENHSSAAGQMDIINTQCQKDLSCYRHEVVGYDRARKIMFGELDVQKDGNGTFIIDVYCGRKVYFTDINEVSGMHDNVNIEHTWPQSKFNGNFPKEMQKSDMHHLYLTDSQANAYRGNNPFGFVTIEKNRLSKDGCSSRHGFMNTRTVYTPPDQHRGNVARALFYFSMHYNLGIDQAQEKTLRQWHKIDPVDEDEIKRHESIAKYQKVRNPFIDHPEAVDKVTDF